MTQLLLLANTHGTGGAQLDALLLSELFTARGYASTVGFLVERERGAPLPEGSFVVSEQSKKSALLAANTVIRAIKEIRRVSPSHIFGFQPASNVIGAVAGLTIPGCRMVATQRNPAQFQSKAGMVLDRLIGSTPLYYSNIAISEAVLASYGRYPASYRARTKVVHNGVPPLSKVDFDMSAARLMLGLNTTGKLLGCLGRLHPQKNVEFAINVLAGLPGTILALAGVGESEASLRRLAESLGVTDRVRFLGTLSGPHISAFYRAIDLLMFPSIYEGFGRVLVEAMSQGTPVIASDLPVVREVCGQSAIILPLAAERWRFAINEALRSDAQRSALAEAGMIQAAKFSMEKMVDGYLAAAGLPAVAE